MKAVVLCAGLGKRLGDLTKDRPKAMLDIGGRPLLEHTIGHLKRHGITEIAINLHYFSDKITAHFGDGSRFGVDIKYSHEKELQGTAGALHGLSAWLQKDQSDFLVIYGDLFTTHDLSSLIAAHRRHQAMATLVLHRRAHSNSVVVVDDDFRLTGFWERPESHQLEKLKTAHGDFWVNSGIQVLSPEILDYVMTHHCFDLPRDVYVPLVGSKKLYGHPLTGERVAIDSEARYREVLGAG